MKDVFGNQNQKNGGGNDGLPNIKISPSLLALGIVILLLIIGFSRSFKIIDAKERGVVRTLGKLSNNTLEPGVQIEIPFISNITTIDISTKKLALDGSKIYTKDQQSATASTVANYNIRPDKVVALYNKLGALDKAALEQSLILPILQSTIRNELGKWTAEQLITEKDRIASRIFENLQIVQNESGLEGIVNFSNFEIVGLNLDESYEAAVRAKVIAEQQAKAAENKTKQVEQEAKQRIIQAEAEAKSVKLRGDALSQNPNLVRYEAVQRWDGKLPQYMLGDSVPLINLDTVNKK
jgi:prohibitin 2